MESLLQQFNLSQSSDISLISFFTSLAVTALLSLLVGEFYIRYGKSLSNRHLFAKNFILIGTTTMFIITIVKSSLALSLGLVGALSIVRFRAAIKEPEGLAYLFLIIGIGLGMGANQPLITISTSIFMLAILWLGQITSKKEVHNNLYLTITSPDSQKIDLDTIIETLEKHCNSVAIKRFDEVEGNIEASFYVDISGFKQISKAKSELQKISPSVQFSFLDNKES